MRYGVLMLVTAVMSVIVIGQVRTLDFERDLVGSPPTGFAFGHTGKVGTPGRWLVQEEGGAKYLAQLDADATRNRFPIAVVSDISAADVDLAVRFRPISGRVDQAAGLVWRYQDEDNYYIVRANALEGNVVLYKVQNGKRTDLPVKGAGRTYGKPSKVPSGRWGTLRVVVRGSLFEVFHDGGKLYEVEDTTFTRAGKVGVWTKADSVTYFDDLTVAR